MMSILKGQRKLGNFVKERGDMELNWDEIKEKYPMVYEKFVNYFRAINYIYKACDFKKEDLETYCYCELEDFFEKNNIYIELFYNSCLKNWCFKLFKFDGIYKSELDLGYGKLKPTARENALLKACEILEGIS